ncbi:hypothetical protein [Methanolacinia paynteri]|uniref:hypothetical protein n=1 Tax=Methanolacinia paynteri TaxID=230356 RepID=UPI00064F9154|nr:hypothetical protein [Methanolacinia paynteri]
MEIIELFEKVLNDANYAGEFNFSDLNGIIGEKKYHALAVQTRGKSTCILVFVNGEGEGAIQVDGHGMMFGDKVVYNIDKNGSFRLFLIDKNLAESISARSRIYEKSHLMETEKTRDLPEFSKFSLKPAKITLIITHEGLPAEGLKVKIFRIGDTGLLDTTSREGHVSFVLHKGKYDCTITDNENREHKYEIIQPGRDAVFNLEI